MSDNKKVFKFKGQQADVDWDGRLCIHVGECTRATGDLFESGRKPWGQPDLADADYLVAVAGRCPTGALTVDRKDGGAADVVPQANVVTVANNGPFYVEGQLEIDGAADDMPGVRYRAALCRCGDSKNKPFCDNTHEAAGFVDRGAVGDCGDADCPTDGPLKISRARNGPLLLTGNVAIRSASGREAWRGAKAALCRCGASKNKPFCDGSHKTAGFEAD